MQQRRLGDHLVAEVVRELPRRAKVDLAADQLAKLGLHLSNAYQRRRPPGHELHQYVHIGVRTEIVAQDAAEQRKLRGPVLRANGGDAIGRQIDAVDEHDPYSTESSASSGAWIRLERIMQPITLSGARSIVWCLAIALVIDCTCAALVWRASWSDAKFRDAYRNAARQSRATEAKGWRAARFPVSWGFWFEGWIDPEYEIATVNLMVDFAQPDLEPLPQSLPPQGVGRVTFGFPFASHSVPVVQHFIGGSTFDWSSGGQVEPLAFSANVLLFALGLGGLRSLTRITRRGGLRQGFG